jgi:Flp pilus assembly protein TadG
MRATWRRLGWRQLASHDRGNAPLELVMLAPVILFLIGLVIAAGRVSVANGAVAAAARDAARQASIAPNRAAAGQAAVSSAEAALRSDGLDCDPIVTTPGLDAAFGSQLGTSALVTAKVTCDVRLSDLTVPGLPGSISLSSTFSSPLDPYRSRDLP